MACLIIQLHNLTCKARCRLKKAGRSRTTRPEETTFPVFDASPLNNVAKKYVEAKWSRPNTQRACMCADMRVCVYEMWQLRYVRCAAVWQNVNMRMSLIWRGIKRHKKQQTCPSATATRLSLRFFALFLMLTQQVDKSVSLVWFLDLKK